MNNALFVDSFDLESKQLFVSAKSFTIFYLFF